MRSLAATYPNADSLQQVAAKLPWGHFVCLPGTVSDPTECDWYDCMADEHDWSRDIFMHWIASGLHRRTPADQPTEAELRGLPESDEERE